MAKFRRVKDVPFSKIFLAVEKNGINLVLYAILCYNHMLVSNFRVEEVKIPILDLYETIQVLAAIVLRGPLLT